MLSMPMNAAVVLQDFGFLRAAELAGLKGLGLSPAGADFDSQVGQSVYRYILVLLAIDFIFLPNFPFPLLPKQVPNTPLLEERTSQSRWKRRKS